MRLSNNNRNIGRRFPKADLVDLSHFPPIPSPTVSNHLPLPTLTPTTFNHLPPPPPPPPPPHHHFQAAPDPGAPHPEFAHHHMVKPLKLKDCQSFPLDARRVVWIYHPLEHLKNPSPVENWYNLLVIDNTRRQGIFDMYADLDGHPFVLPTLLLVLAFLDRLIAVFGDKFM
ncbi:hypothetical protein PCANC_26926 [Puccinia coronata f. sp. avenae]|uniref:Uncharacterized protein n=1 Tax=Puccinia coronata f. sp. avenae TaxID=200324 RepID=A0A2N5TQM7_9BASI|nr:hypothetical protein PCANC_26926 [Puccinia coronata f. sp. avenae]